MFKKEIGPKQPKFVKIMDEDIVFFRGKAEKVHALFDWCLTGALACPRANPCFQVPSLANITAIPSMVKVNAWRL